MSAYLDGSPVKVGDRVRYSGEGYEESGIVVCDISGGVYTDAFSDAHWAFLKDGFVVEFDRSGIVHFNDDLADEDLTLVARQEQDR